MGELYFKHLCYQRAYCFIKLEDVYKSLPGQVLQFKFIYQRIPILIPKALAEEVSRVSRPSVINGTQSFVFDFLTCKAYEADSTKKPNSREPDDFCWVEIKSGGSRLSRHQYQTAQACNIRFAIFRIVDAESPPEEVEIEWEFDSWRQP